MILLYIERQMITPARRCDTLLGQGETLERIRPKTSQIRIHC